MARITNRQAFQVSLSVSNPWNGKDSQNDCSKVKVKRIKIPSSVRLCFSCHNLDGTGFRSVISTPAFGSKHSRLLDIYSIITGWAAGICMKRVRWRRYSYMSFYVRFGYLYRIPYESYSITLWSSRTLRSRSQFNCAKLTAIKTFL